MDSNSDHFYYGIFIPPESNRQLDNDYADPSVPRIHVYTDKVEALKIVKKFKARFKVFKTKAEAENFALRGSVQTVTSPEAPRNATLAEKPTQFRGPTVQDLVKLRKMIEEGQLELFKKTIWDNPRYLISSGDTPSILKEGHRYNALHIATKAMNERMCEVILETVSCAEFMQLLYGEDNLELCQDRANIMLDLYLNTPDKGLNETPLHFAVKYGALGCVQVLTSYTQCDRNLKNKHNQLPKEIVCQRCSSSSAELCDKINALLDDQFYVPVFRSEDGTSVPEIGTPFSPINPPILNNDPISPRIEIHAYAGPMNMNQAVQFRKKWKTPPRMLREQTSALRSKQQSPTTTASSTYRYLYDPEKGLERLGRQLAHDNHIGWKEYWPFLETFVDIASNEGLKLLEKYIAKKYESAVTQLSPDYDKHPNYEYFSDTEEQDDNRSTSPMSELCRALKNCAITNFSPEMVTTYDYTVSSNKKFDKPSANLDNPNICPFLCVEKSLQVFATRIFNHMTNCIVHDLNLLINLVNNEVQHLISLVCSYKSDKRFSEVDFSTVHYKMALLVGEKIHEEFFDPELETFVKCFNFIMLNSGEINQHMTCILKRIVDNLEKSFNDLPFTSYTTEEECRKSWLNGKQCDCAWNSKVVKARKNSFRTNSKAKRSTFRYRSPEHNSDSSDYSLFNSSDGDISRRLIFNDGGRNVDKNRADGDVLTDDSLSNDEMASDDEVFYTPPTSPIGVTGVLDSDEEMLDVSDQGAIDVFIEGSRPTKIDANVYDAIKDVQISNEEYPNIYRWRHTVQLYSEEDRERWPNLLSHKLQIQPKYSTSRYNNNNNSLNNTSSPSLLLSSPPVSPLNTPPNCSALSPSWTRVTGIHNSPLSSRKMCSSTPSKRLFFKK